MAAVTPRRRHKAPRRSPTIVVVGSVNMDLVMQLPRLPGLGETLAASAFRTLPGGKGANQAVAIARLGGRVAMIGRVGADVFGARLLEGLREEGVDIKAVRAVPRSHSGVAFIGVDPSGQNSIAIAGGANALLRPADIREQSELIARADALLLQLEIPLTTAATALRIARRHGVPTILDTAPVPPGGLPDAFREVDILSPNQSEAALLSGHSCHNPAEARRVADALIRQFDPGLVVIKMGAQGALASAGTAEALHCPAFRVKAVDTTAAGDAFSAALTLRLAEGASLGQALAFACAAGALATTRMGARDSMPRRAAVEKLLRQHPKPHPD